MVTEQTQLLASFPGFIDTIEQKLEGFDVHIMTANPDGNWPGWTSARGRRAVLRTTGRTAARTPEDYDCGTYPDLVTSATRSSAPG
jgi:hypothetical protein